MFVMTRTNLSGAGVNRRTRQLTMNVESNVVVTEIAFDARHLAINVVFGIDDVLVA
jgi:hypothetical protein